MSGAPTRLRVTAKAASIEALHLHPEAFEPGPGSEEFCVVEIRSAAVNPSDVKAALGAMPHAVFPRTPGRDWAGIVVDGPAALKGKEAWGTGGDVGIRRDGSHATHLVLPAAMVRAKPAALTLEEAGAVGVPFITAYQGLQRAGLPKAGDNVLVLGANGKVGQAAVQIAAAAGAKVFAVMRRGETYPGHAGGAPDKGSVETIDAASQDIAETVRSGTGGHGADIVYNTVGSPYFEQANKAMALHGRQIFISTLDRAVPFDIFAFYRGQHSFVGIDTLALTGAECAVILDALAPSFESGALKPFPVMNDSIYPLEEADAAYRAVLAGAKDRIILRP